MYVAGQNLPFYMSCEWLRLSGLFCWTRCKTGKLESKDNSTNPLVSEGQEQSKKLNVSKVFLIIFECKELSTDFVNQQEK